MFGASIIVLQHKGKHLINSLRFLAILLLIIPLLVIGAFPSHAQENMKAVVYVNDRYGLSIIMSENDTFSTPQDFWMPTSPSPTTNYILAASSSGGQLAVITHNLRGEAPYIAELHILNVPSGEIRLTQTLLPADFPTQIPAELGNPHTEMIQAIGEMAWSPDGTRLAFISGHNGTSADVYIFEASSNQIRALEPEAGAAGLLSWSPDSKWLVYSDLQTFGGEAGYLSNGIFALGVADDNSEQVIRLDFAIAYPNDVIRVGWRDAETILLSSHSFIAGARGLYSWHIPSNTVSNHLPETLELSVPVYGAFADIAAFIVPDLGENIPLTAGFYLAPLTADEPILVYEGEFYSVQQVNASYFKLIGTPGELLLNANSLEETILISGDEGTFVSPTTEYVVAYFPTYIQIMRQDGTILGTLSVEGALPPDWSSDGTQFFTFGFTENGAGLLLIDVENQSVQLLDSTIALNGPWVIVSQ